MTFSGLNGMRLFSTNSTMLSSNERMVFLLIAVHNESMLRMRSLGMGFEISFPFICWSQIVWFLKIV